MKHKIKVEVESTKRGLFGIPHKVKETKTVTISDKEYKKMIRRKKKSILDPWEEDDELCFFDDWFGDD